MDIAQNVQVFLLLIALAILLPFALPSRADDDPDELLGSDDGGEW